MLSQDHTTDRRRLLAGLGALPLAGMAGRALAQDAAGKPLPSSADLGLPPEQRTGWAIVGLGNFAVGQIMPNFARTQRSRMTALVSGNPGKAQALGAKYGVTSLYDYRSYDRLAGDAQVQCVYIVLPVGLHAEYTIRALEAGKHVLCEKPMAIDARECERMVAAAKANNRQLGVAYRVHFEPTNMEALRRVRAGELGTMRVVQCDHGFNADPNSLPMQWRLTRELGGGGSMYDIGIYGLNTSLMMLDGDRPAAVSATWAYPKDDPRFAQVEGGLAYRVRMASGVVVSGTSSYCWKPGISRQRYMGADASIEMQPATSYDGNELVLEGGDQPRRMIQAGDPTQQFANQLDGFSDAARTNTAHRTPGEMGLRDIRLIEAMYRSARGNGAEVKM